MKVIVIPNIVETLGTILKNLEKKMEKLEIHGKIGTVQIVGFEGFSRRGHQCGVGRFLARRGHQCGV